MTLASTQARRLKFDDAKEELRNPVAARVPADAQALAVAVAPSDSLALVPFVVGSVADSLALVPFDENNPPATPSHGQRPDASYSHFGFKVALPPYTLHTEP